MGGLGNPPGDILEKGKSFFKGDSWFSALTCSNKEYWSQQTSFWI